MLSVLHLGGCMHHPAEHLLLEQPPAGRACRTVSWIGDAGLSTRVVPAQPASCCGMCSASASGEAPCSSSGLGSANTLPAGPTEGDPSACHSVAALPALTCDAVSRLALLGFSSIVDPVGGHPSFNSPLSAPCAASAPKRVGERRSLLTESRSIRSPIIRRLSRRR